jgi:hypothetical protein
MNTIMLFALLIYNAHSELFSRTIDVWRDWSFIVTWIIDTSAQTITWDIKVKSYGWVGVGLSRSMTMKYANMVVGYIANNKAIVQGCYSLGVQYLLCHLKLII